MSFDVAIWGTVAEWVSGLGTLAAVIVALWLGNRRPPEFVSWDVFYHANAGQPLLDLVLKNAGVLDVVVRDATFSHRGVFIPPIDRKFPLQLGPGRDLRLRFRVGGVTPRKTEVPYLLFETGRKIYTVTLPGEVRQAIGD